MQRFFLLITGLSVTFAFRQQVLKQQLRIIKTYSSTTTDKTSSIDILEDRSFLRNLEEKSYDLVTGAARFLSPSSVDNAEREINDNIKEMEGGMTYLEEVAGKKSELNPWQFTSIVGAVALAVSSPLLFGSHTVALIVPAMTGVSFTVGSAYEYLGKVAVADGKESCATCFQTIAETDIVYCQAERVKSVLPTCVGIATTAAVLTLLVKSFAKLDLVEGEILTAFFSLISVLAAAIAGLANEETRTLVQRSMELGRKKFVTGVTIGEKWESETDRVMGRAEKFNSKWVQFAIGVLPAPVIASFFPGEFGAQGIICSAIAAAQAAYYLVLTEYSLTQGLDSLGSKWRAASVAEQYSRQGVRAGSSLPFLTALGGLCLGLAAATSEAIPFIPSVVGRMVMAAIFPTGAAMFAASSIVLKDKCEVGVKIGMM